MGGGQGQDQGAEQLALARAGGPDAQPVGAHAQLGRLLEVEQQRLPGVGHPDRHPEDVALAAGRPQGGQVEVGRVVDAEHARQAHRAGVRVVLDGRGGREPQRGQQAGQPLGQGGRDLVGHAGHRRRRAGAAEVLHRHLPVLQGDPDGHLLGLVQPVGNQVEDGDAHVPGRDRLVGGGQLGGHPAVGVVDDQQPAGQGQGLAGVHAPPGLGGVGRPGRQVAGHRPGQLVERGRDPAGLGLAVAAFGVEQVRQPLGPRPVVQPPGRAGQRHRQVVGGVPGRRLHQQGPGQPERLGPVADHADVPGPVQGHGQGHLRGGGEAPLHRPGLGEHEGVGGPQRAAAVGQHQGSGRHPAHPDPDPEEVGVGAAPLPAPGRVADDVEQGRRWRVEGRGRGPLPVLLGRRPLAQLLQVLEVAVALLAAPAGRLAALGQQHGQAAEHRHQHDQGPHGQHGRVAEDQHHAERRGRPGHREQRLHRVAGPALGQGRRGLDHERPGLAGRADHPRRPVHQPPQRPGPKL
jgi:hypothetical protein